MQIKTRYYAVFREARGVSTEMLDTHATTPSELYDEIGLPLAKSLVRVAVNGEFVPLDSPLREGDEVVFIPPVAGG